MKLHKDVRILGVIVLGVITILGILRITTYCYTAQVVSRARENGLYPTAEAAMQQLIFENYDDIERVKIFYAGPNNRDGSDPHVWFVIAEVHAKIRADGSTLGEHNCDAPGTFFLQTHDGWFHVPEGAFPGMLGKWMQSYGLAGPGQAVPSINLHNNRPYRYCQYD
jgi:hypothetical protein